MIYQKSKIAYDLFYLFSFCGLTHFLNASYAWLIVLFFL